MKKLLSTLIISVSAVLFTGCLSGYQTGSLNHPQISKLALAKIQNQTKEVTLQGYTQQGALSALQNYTTMKVTGKENADAILYARITDYSSRGVDTSYRADNRDDNDGTNYGSTVFECRVTIEFTVLAPGRQRPVISTQQVTGTSRYNELADLEQTRQHAAKLACADASRQMIAAITEAW